MNNKLEKSEKEPQRPATERKPWVPPALERLNLRDAMAGAVLGTGDTFSS